MNFNLKTSHAIVAGVMLAVSGVVHGMWTHRWSAPNDVSGRDLLSEKTGPLGDWAPGNSVAMDEKETPKGAIATAQYFTNSKTNKQVVVSLTRGAPGVVAAHTPDVCFLGSGYKLKSPPSKQVLPIGDGATVAFYVADFEKTTASGTESVRCRWSWSADGKWHAPDYPRLFFAKSQMSLPVLYKLYIVHPIGDEDLTKNDPYRTFAADLASALGQNLAN